VRRSARTTPPTRCSTIRTWSSAAYPHLVKRCYALSGIFDLRDFMGGMYDDNFYFQNPMDYMPNLNERWYLEQLASCEIRLVTGSGPYEKSGYSYAMSAVLARKGIRHSLDDWGARGGHDWPYWKEQVREYISRW
jgi:esterase/lipase superfamily enzyme